MPAKKGSALVIDLAGTAMISVRSKTVTLNNTTVDVTTDGDTDPGGAHWEVLLATVKSLNITGSGVADAQADYDAVQAFAFADPPLAAASTITFVNGATLSGDLLIESFEESGEVAGEGQFSITIRAASAMTYAAPAP